MFEALKGTDYSNEVAENRLQSSLFPNYTKELLDDIGSILNTFDILCELPRSRIGKVSYAARQMAHHGGIPVSITH